MGHALGVLRRNSWILGYDAGLAGIISKSLGTICRAFGDSFFASDVRIGRLIAAVLLILEPRTFLHGAVSALLAARLGDSMSQDRGLKGSGLFALNGLFAGMAVHAFIPGVTQQVIATAIMIFVVNLLVVAGRRFLRTWDLPVLVLPYCIGFWGVQLLARASSHFRVEVSAPAMVSPGYGVASIATGSLNGFGQIFFTANSFFGLTMMAILMVFAGRRWLLVAAAAILPAAIAWLALGNHWAIASGLTSFGGILLFSAWQAGALSLFTVPLWVLIAVSGIAEVALLQLVGVLGIFGLSGSYVLIFWLGKLCEETRRGADSRGPAMMSW